MAAMFIVNRHAEHTLIINLGIDVSKKEKKINAGTE